eukprot:TRINITY_DN20336_c0_g1_i1.p1 TRINITY_DN20336_c0_g1~~TRINITY_DN20336_c0_g1_i1.p1  ORF type:complete len:144 (-),score=26.22 TRINITY_DN20336_c0_g1_i1:139-570(-)
MGWFGGSPDTSSNSETIDLSKYSAGEFGSKLKSSSSFGSEFDTSPDSSAGFSSAATGKLARGGGGGGADIQQAVAVEQQKLQFMSQVHKLNDTCWDLCVGSMSSSLSGREETCLTNCVERFVDTTMLITNRFAQLAQKMQGLR